MWRYLAGGAAALLMVALGVLIVNARARPTAVLPPQPLAAAGQPTQATAAGTPLPDAVPEATERTREQKRFDRYDKDRNGKVTREEYLLARHKAFAKLDTNHDGQLSFDEWAIKAETKFAVADKDKSNTLTPAEFATTAVKRKAPRRVNCPPAAAQPAAQED
ncbi:EF-hand domain-containing protein [Sphingomonas bacterium]|uniref:EF-hand domain-containing protein n=1 Tax=Sphingomonas bacterium TaxID=1895847 RepID=UPI0015766B83|nr:EF-hand domain-containing protein [Sphingomonas bacterium]